MVLHAGLVIGRVRAQLARILLIRLVQGAKVLLGSIEHSDARVAGAATRLLVILELVVGAEAAALQVLRVDLQQQQAAAALGGGLVFGDCGRGRHGRRRANRGD